VNVASPVLLRRAARGYGFSLTAIRVFYGDSGYFTLHHMISVRTHRIVHRAVAAVPRSRRGTGGAQAPPNRD